MTPKPCSEIAKEIVRSCGMEISNFNNGVNLVVRITESLQTERTAREKAEAREEVLRRNLENAYAEAQRICPEFDWAGFTKTSEIVVMALYDQIKIYKSRLQEAEADKAFRDATIKSYEDACKLNQETIKELEARLVDKEVILAGFPESSYKWRLSKAQDEIADLRARLVEREKTLKQVDYVGWEGYAEGLCRKLYEAEASLSRHKAVVERLINVGMARAEVLYETNKGTTEQFLLNDFREAKQFLDSLEGDKLKGENNDTKS